MDLKVSDALMEIGLKCERAYHVCLDLTDYFDMSEPDAANLEFGYSHNQALAFVVLDYLRDLDGMIKELEERINA